MIPQLLIMMMEGAHEKDPAGLLRFLLLCIPEAGDTQNDYAEALYQEDPAEDGYSMPFLPNDDGEGGNDALEGQDCLYRP